MAVAKSGLTDRQIKVYKAIILMCFQVIFGITFIFFMFWTFYELFKESTTEASKWKYVWIQTFNSATVFYIIRRIFPKE